MSEPTKNGKKPLSARAPLAPITAESEFGNALTIGPDLKKELEDQGLVGRFINAKQLYDFQGYHPKGWIPYKRKQCDTIGSVDFVKGSDPSGIIRRGDCILATKSVAQVDRHRQLLKEKAARLSGYTKEAATSLQALGAPVGAKIDSGYEKQDGDED